MGSGRVSRPVTIHVQDARRGRQPGDRQLDPDAPGLGTTSTILGGLTRGERSGPLARVCRRCVRRHGPRPPILKWVIETSGAAYDDELGHRSLHAPGRGVGLFTDVVPDEPGSCGNSSVSASCRLGR